MGSWLRWRRAAIPWWTVHPPFAFALLEAAYKARRGELGIERERKRLRKDRHSFLTSVDHGAGSNFLGQRKTVSAIARTSLKRRRYATAVAAWAEVIGAQRVLELGTCLGITTAYLANRRGVEVTTLEGNADRLKVAAGVWQRLGLDERICGVEGKFSESLPDVLSEGVLFDLIFIDGHHEGEALKGYLRQLLAHLAEGGLVVCDDIHWSADMEKAWEEIVASDEWTLVMDTFEMGVLSRRKGLTPSRFSVRLSGVPRPVL